MTSERWVGTEPATASGDLALAAEAAALGLVSRKELLDGAVEIRPAAAGGGVRALAVRGHVLDYAKPVQRRPVDERLVVRRLASLDLGPRCHGDLATLWTSALPGAPLDQLAGDVWELADLAQAWGLAVAQLHTVRVAGPGPAPRPWVLAAEPRPPRTLPRLSAAAAAVLRTLTNDPALRRAAAQADDRWIESVWIHGNLSAAHVIVQRQPQLRTRFVGLGRAGAGDPSWDVACAVETLVGHAPRWRTSERVLIDHFLRGYRRGSGPGRLDPDLRALRAIEIAWHVAVTEDGPAEVREWLTRARSYAAHSAPSRWAA